MKKFNYKKYIEILKDKEINAFLNKIYEMKGSINTLINLSSVNLTKLTNLSKISSIYSSNKIENIKTSSTRFKQIILYNDPPKSKGEEEIIGYRYVLELIMNDYTYIPFNINILL